MGADQEMTDSELHPYVEWIVREARRPVAVAPDARARLLDALRSGLNETGPECSTAQLWPEHFDLGCNVEGVNFGCSPGDAGHPEPYVYVGPWDRTRLPQRPRRRRPCAAQLPDRPLSQGQRPARALSGNRSARGERRAEKRAPKSSNMRIVHSSLNDRDVRLLRQVVTTLLNLELSVADEIVGIACEVKPDQATLVPGDAVYFDSSTAHSYSCAGSKPASALIVTMHQPLPAPAAGPPRHLPGAPMARPLSLARFLDNAVPRTPVDPEQQE